jgi:hypothetical protein
MSFELNASQLRTEAKEAIVKSNAIFDIKEKIYNTAKKGQAYLKTGFLKKYLKELQAYCNKKELLFKDMGDDGEGSDYTTIIIDWSERGDGLLN